MQDEKNTLQQLGRTENLVENLKSVRTSADDELDISRLEDVIAKASPLPVILEGGRIVSAPLANEWAAVEREYPDRPMPDDDPRWDTLPDPTVGYVTPSVDGQGQGDRDGALIVAACNALPRLIRHIRALEMERDQANKHLRTIRKEFAATRGAMSFLSKRARST